MSIQLWHFTGVRPRQGRPNTVDERAVHADLLDRIRRASPFPAGTGPARDELAARTRESLRVLRARKESSEAGIWAGARGRPVRRTQR